MPHKPKKKQDNLKPKRKQLMVRKRGKKAIPEKLLSVLKPTEEDVMKLLAAQCHIGRRRAHVNMKRYIWKRRADGVHIINLEKTWAKIVLAARILVTIKNKSDIVVMSTRTYGQRGAIKFATYTGCTAEVGKWVPGTFTNPKNQRAYKEPRLLIVDDPQSCFAALRETSYVGIPTIAFCGTDCNSRFVDCVIPINNRGKFSIGLAFYLLAREYLRMKGEIFREEEWKESVDLFFYRTAEEIQRIQDVEKASKMKDEQPYPQDSEQFEEAFGDDDVVINQTEVVEQKETEEQTWDVNPPEEFQEPDDWGNDAQPDTGLDYEKW